MIPHGMSSRQALFARFCRKSCRFSSFPAFFSLPLPLLTRFFRFRTPLPDAHTGVAISDRTLTLTGFSTVITAYRPEAVIEKLLPLISEHEVTELVLGHPLNMDGTRGPRAEKAEGFAEMLREATSLPVTLWDERRTTVDAHNILLNNGKRAKERKKTVDAVAASLMLEGYLTFKKRQG